MRPKCLSKVTKLLIVQSILALFLGSCASVASDPEYFVDAAVPASGNGLSWDSAFKTIKEATKIDLLPGSIVWIKPGSYNETMYVKVSGKELVPMSTGVDVKKGNQVKFPSSVDLSKLDLKNHVGRYYLYLARSWASNNGVYKVISIDKKNNIVTVEGASFIDESGKTGDLMYLSASIGLPVQFKNSDPAAGKVLLDVSADKNSSTVLYIGNGWIEPCGAEAPVSNINIDGLTLTGSNTSGGIHIQCGSNIVVSNCNISNMWGAAGILVNGNKIMPAMYNYLIGNTITDTTSEAIYIGAGGQGEDCNYTQFTHVIDNNISHGADAWMENAIEVKEYHDIGTVIESNSIHDFALNNFWNGAINLQPGADNTLVYSNILRDITPAYEEDPIYIIGVDAGGDPGTIESKKIYIFNNLIYNTVPFSDKAYFAFGLRGDHTSNINIFNNSVNNINGALYLHYDSGNGSDNGVSIFNNIFSVPDMFTSIIEADFCTAFGSFKLSNNLFTHEINGPYSVSSEWIGDPDFDKDMKPKNIKSIIDRGSSFDILKYDFDFSNRKDAPDLGALEE